MVNFGPIFFKGRKKNLVYLIIGGVVSLEQHSLFILYVYVKYIKINSVLCTVKRLMFMFFWWCGENNLYCHYSGQLNQSCRHTIYTALDSLHVNTVGLEITPLPTNIHPKKGMRHFSPFLENWPKTKSSLSGNIRYIIDVYIVKCTHTACFI